MPKQEKQIFKKGSTTFFLSSLFFPSDIKKDVFDLYSFVRVADDYVDQTPQDAIGFKTFREQWEQATIDSNFDTERSEFDSKDVRVIKNMLRVARKHHFDLSWVDSFLDSMQSDLTDKKYESIKDTLWYIHGSAEVIGLMMANIMQLEPEAAHSAKMQGRAMQIINFIRDIDEDNKLGRMYFPADELEQFSLVDLSRKTAHAQKDDFNNFIQFQLARYDEWQRDAYTGYHFIPRRLRIPLQTATDMYNWTAEEIRINPLQVFRGKIKPGRGRVIAAAFRNFVR